MDSEERAKCEIARMEVVARMDKDLDMIKKYRSNEWFYIDRIRADARTLGVLDERLGGSNGA